MSTTIPPHVPVSHTVIGFDATTIYVTQGKTRFVIDAVTEGQADMTQAIEWVHTLALSPVAAMQICRGLSEVLQKYAQQFGAIPEDPDYRAKIAPAGVLN